MAELTAHDVLAAAYPRGKLGPADDQATLTHASLNRGETALCGKVKPGSLSNDIALGPVTCKACLRLAAREVSRG